MDKVFKMMGFEDTEDCGRNAGCHIPAAKAEQKPATRVDTQNHVTVQISDDKYEAMSFAGPV